MTNISNSNSRLETQVRPPSHLTEDAICTGLLDILEALLRGKADNWRHELSMELERVFSSWKEECGNRSPRTWRGRTRLGRRKPIDFACAAPYECADVKDGICDYVTLLLHLADAKYPAAQVLLESEDFDDLIAVSAFIAPETVKLDSLLVAVRIVTAILKYKHRDSTSRAGLLASALIETSPARTLGENTTKNLTTGRAKGAKAKADKAGENHAQWFEEAVNLIIKQGMARNEAAYVIHRNGNFNPNGRYACRTIYDAIAGSLQEARRRRK